MLLALIGPAATLAEEVRTGKLGGVCAVSAALGDGADAAFPVSHCDSCGSLAFALPPFAAQGIPTSAGRHVAGIHLSFDLAARISGLPPNRGPPAL